MKGEPERSAEYINSTDPVEQARQNNISDENQGSSLTHCYPRRVSFFQLSKV